MEQRFSFLIKCFFFSFYFSWHWLLGPSNFTNGTQEMTLQLKHSQSPLPLVLSHCGIYQYYLLINYSNIVGFTLGNVLYYSTAVAAPASLCYLSPFYIIFYMENFMAIPFRLCIFWGLMKHLFTYALIWFGYKLISYESIVFIIKYYLFMI